MSGVVEATETAFRKHPVWVVGGFAGLVLVLYLFTRSSGSSSAPATTIAYQVGPSDASVEAGTALQIAQVQANSANFQASTQAQAQGSVASDYFGYLNNAATLQAGTVINGQNLTSTDTINGQNAAVALGTVQSNNALSGTVSSNNTAAQIANYNAYTAQTQSYNNLAGTVAMYNADVNINNNQTAVQQQANALHAAQQGSVDYQNSLNQQFLQSTVWSAIQSGQSTDSITALENAAQVAFNGTNANGNGF